MATTGLTGSQAEYSSALVRGMAGDTVGMAAGVAATTGEAATAGVVVAATMDAQATADEVTAMLDGATRVAGSEAVTRFTAAEVDSMVAAADSTAEVGTAAADTGNPGLARSPRVKETAGSERCQPFLLLRRRRFLLECAFSRILP